MPVLKEKKWLIAGFALLFFAVFFFLKLATNAPPREEPKAGAGEKEKMTMIPETLSLEGKGAGAKRLKDFKGKVLLINFWAGWCGPCLHEMPGLYAVQREFSARGFSVLAISMDEDFSGGMSALRRVAGAPPFPIFKGVGSEMADHFPIEGLPYTVILDKSLRVVYARAGEVDWNAPRARRLIEELL